MTARSLPCRSSTRWPRRELAKRFRARIWCGCRRRRPSASRRSARAHAAWSGGEATDDAQVARAAGLDVAIVEGDPALEKLTYEADFARAEARPAQPARRLRLRRPRLRARARNCGSAASASPTTGALPAIATPTSSLHALTDAILGALGAGDIGDHFPPSRPAMARRGLVAVPRTCPRPGRAGRRPDRACRRHHHLRSAADRPASGRDARRGSRRLLRLPPSQD